MGLSTGGVRERYRLAIAILALAAFACLLSSPAGATPSVLNGELPCSTQPDGVRHCAGPGGDAPADTVPSFDGTPIDLNIALPDSQKFGGGPYPLAMYFHGFGGEKERFDGYLKRFTDRGIAALGMTERGFKKSCGSQAAIAELEAESPGACDQGFIHLMDTRYEVRDAQFFAGLLADEGLVHPGKIGAVGGSYGGGKSLALATLKDRVMLPDGSLVPWKSPAGKPMSIAVAAPVVPWSDMAYSLAPNGGTLDYVTASPYGKPYGVMKSGIVSGLFATGENFSGSYGGPVDPFFDVIGWRNQLAAGEPYNSNPLLNTAVEQLTTYHSAYYLDNSVQPAPMFISQGLTDDIFPVDEAIRYVNRAKARHPEATIGLYVADIGHPRALLATQGRPEDIKIADARIETWFAHYLLGEGPVPGDRVVARSQVCPYEEPSGGPFTAPTWAELAPGEVRLADRKRHVIAAGSGADEVASGFLSLLPGCAQVPETEEPGTVSWDFPAPGGAGYTVAGSTTVIADISSANGGESQLAARLLEVKDGQLRLIGRALHRPQSSGRQVFQLHANVFHIGPGAHLRLQLLPKDGMTGPSSGVSYGRPSNDQGDIVISDVEIRVPVAEGPGAVGGAVRKPMPKVLPAGRALAAQFRSAGKARITGLPRAVRVRITGRRLVFRIACPPSVNRCLAGRLRIQGAGRKGPVGRNLVGTAVTPRLMTGKGKVLQARLTGRSLRLLKKTKARVLRLKLTLAGSGHRQTQRLTVKLRPPGK